MQQLTRCVGRAGIIRFAPHVHRPSEHLRNDDGRRTPARVHLGLGVLRARAVRVRLLVRGEERFEGGEVDGRLAHDKMVDMKNYTAVVERDPATGLLVGYIPGFPGAHSQGESLDELSANLREVVAMLLEDGEPKLEAEFVGTQSIAVG